MGDSWAEGFGDPRGVSDPGLPDNEKLECFAEEGGCSTDSLVSSIADCQSAEVWSGN